MTFGTKFHDSTSDIFLGARISAEVLRRALTKEGVMSPMNRSRLVVVLAALLFALGCTSTSPAPAPASEWEAPKESAPVAEFGDSGGVAVSPAPAVLEPVYFDTDQAVLRINARDSLKRYAKSILAHPEWGVVTIDGHCDERGSDQHNRALGTQAPESGRKSLSFGKMSAGWLQMRLWWGRWVNVRRAAGKALTSRSRTFTSSGGAAPSFAAYPARSGAERSP